MPQSNIIGGGFNDLVRYFQEKRPMVKTDEKRLGLRTISDSKFISFSFEGFIGEGSPYAQLNPNLPPFGPNAGGGPRPPRTDPPIPPTSMSVCPSGSSCSPDPSGEPSVPSDIQSEPSNQQGPQ